MSRAGIKFDLSVLNISANAVENATLSFYRVAPPGISTSGYVDGSQPKFDQNCRFTTHRITKDYPFETNDYLASDAGCQVDEFSTAFDGSFDSSAVLDEYMYETGYLGWLDFDVTDAVKDMIANPADNHGFVLMSSLLLPIAEESGVNTILNSSEAAEITLRPKLVINGETSVTPVTPVRTFAKAEKLFTQNNRSLHFTSGSQVESVAFFTLNGVKVKEFSAVSGEEISLYDLPASVYLIQATMKNTIQTSKLILE